MILALLAAVSFQNTATLDRAVTAFAGHAIGEEGGARAAVDPRLRLAACSMVSLVWRSEAHDAVVATCTGPDWRIFVPVRRSAIAGFAPQAVAPVIAVKAEPVIRRGDPVVIEAGNGGFQITREGVATADAAPGARVPVRVEGTTAPVQAVAVAAGRVTLPGWTS